MMLRNAPRTLDELDELVADCETNGRHADTAAALEALVDRLVPDAELSRAEVLAAAAEHWQLAGDVERALELFASAAADGAQNRIDPRAQIARVLLGLGRTEEARAALAEVPLAGSRSLHSLFYVGEVYEDLGDLDQAHRWFTKGATIAERGSDNLGFALLVMARRRVRFVMELPLDELDELGERLVYRAEDALFDALVSLPGDANAFCPCGSGRKTKRCRGR